MGELLGIIVGVEDRLVDSLLIVRLLVEEEVTVV